MMQLSMGLGTWTFLKELLVEWMNKGMLSLNCRGTPGLQKAPAQSSLLFRLLTKKFLGL